MPNISYMLVPGLGVGSILNQIKSDAKITPTQIMDIVAYSTNIPHDMIKKSIRKRPIVEARYLFFYFCKNYTNLSLATIGSYVESGDHATVRHALKVVENLKSTNAVFLGKLEKIKISVKTVFYNISNTPLV